MTRATKEMGLHRKLRTEGFIQQFAQQTIQGTEGIGKKYTKRVAHKEQVQRLCCCSVSATDLITDYHKALSDATFLN